MKYKTKILAFLKAYMVLTQARHTNGKDPGNLKLKYGKRYSIKTLTKRKLLIAVPILNKK